MKDSLEQLDEQAQMELRRRVKRLTGVIDSLSLSGDFKRQFLMMLTRELIDGLGMGEPLVIAFDRDCDGVLKSAQFCIKPGSDLAEMCAMLLNSMTLAIDEMDDATLMELDMLLPDGLRGASATFVDAAKQINVGVTRPKAMVN